MLAATEAANIGRAVTTNINENNVIKRLVLVLLLLGVLFGAIFGWKYLQMQQQMAEQRRPAASRRINSTRHASKDWQPALQAVGSITPVTRRGHLGRGAGG